MAKRKTEMGLGRGLNALLGDPDLTAGGEGSVSLPISQVEPGLNQPRKRFEPEALADLAESIRIHGIIQPLTVRRLASGYYQIIAGERRWRAAKQAGLDEIPAVVIEADDRKVMELGLIENLQREDLTPLEEARGYRTLIETQDFTQEEVSQAVGKSRPAITNALRLLNLPQDIQQMLENGEITAGHARTLLSFKTEEGMRLGAKKAKEGASVRELEALAKRLNEEKEGPVKAPRKNQYYEEAQLAVGEYLNRKVKVAGSKKKGTLQIEFYGEEDLQNLLHDLHMN